MTEGEPPQAHSLEWMPLAVRYKLDLLGMTIRLSEWQALSPDVRRGLLEIDVGDAQQLAACRQAFLHAGAKEDMARLRDWGGFEKYLNLRGAAR